MDQWGAPMAVLLLSSQMETCSWQDLMFVWGFFIYFFSYSPCLSDWLAENERCRCRLSLRLGGETFSLRASFDLNAAELIFCRWILTFCDLIYLQMFSLTFGFAVEMKSRRLRESFANLQTQTDGRTDGRIDGQAIWWTERWMDGRMDKWMNGQTVRWMDKTSRTQTTYTLKNKLSN